MQKNLLTAASAATILIFLGAGCSQIPVAKDTQEVTNPDITEPQEIPVVTQTQPTSAPKETTNIKQRENEDDNENEGDDEDEREGQRTTTVAPTPVTQPQVKPITPAPTPAPTVKTYTMAEVQKANNASNCWSIISGKVYNLTPFTPGHPGGEAAILSICGKDGTAAFSAQHGGQGRPEATLAKYYIGVLK